MEIIIMRALQEHHIPLDEQLICSGAATRQYAYQSVLELLRLSEPPSAIFAASDIGASVASGAYRVRDCVFRYDLEAGSL